MVKIVLLASIWSPFPFGLWLEQGHRRLQERKERWGRSSGCWEIRERRPERHWPVNTDSGAALPYPVDSNEGPSVCGFQGSFQFIPAQNHNVYLLSTHLRSYMRVTWPLSKEWGKWGLLHFCLHSFLIQPRIQAYFNFTVLDHLNHELGLINFCNKAAC